MAKTSSTRSSSDELCQLLLDAAIAEGVDLQCIIAGANAYRRQIEETGQPQLPPWKWLASRGWEQHRH